LNGHFVFALSTGTGHDSLVFTTMSQDIISLAVVQESAFLFVCVLFG